MKNFLQNMPHNGSIFVDCIIHPFCSLFLNLHIPLCYVAVAELPDAGQD